VATGAIFKQPGFETEQLAPSPDHLEVRRASLRFDPQPFPPSPGQDQMVSSDFALAALARGGTMRFAYRLTALNYWSLPQRPFAYTARLCEITPSTEGPSEPERTPNLAILATLLAVLELVITAVRTSNPGSSPDIAHVVARRSNQSL
jgi:hypothetical protein